MGDKIDEISRSDMVEQFPLFLEGQVVLVDFIVGLH